MPFLGYLPLTTVASYTPEEIKSISPELMSTIRDDVVVELLQDEKFFKSIAAVVESVKSENDSCKFISPANNEVVITSEISTKIQELAEPVAGVEDGEFYEIIEGRITKVDIDALRRHVGFKYNGEGATTAATFEEMPDLIELKSLLGEWVEFKGTVSYVGATRSHIDIKEYSRVKRIEQDSLNLPEEEAKEQ